MKKSRRTYNGVHLNKKSNTQDVVEQSLTEFHHFLKVCFLGNNNLINNLKMKEKIKNQRSAGKIIPLHSKFTELTNDVSKDTGVLYGQKRKEVRHAELG